MKKMFTGAADTAINCEICCIKFGRFGNSSFDFKVLKILESATLKFFNKQKKIDQ